MVWSHFIIFHLQPCLTVKIACVYMCVGVCCIGLRDIFTNATTEKEIHSDSGPAVQSVCSKRIQSPLHKEERRGRGE